MRKMPISVFMRVHSGPARIVIIEVETREENTGQTRGTSL